MQEDLSSNNQTNEDITKALIEIENEESKKSKTVNKRIDFSKKSLRRIETMLPVYREELEGTPSTSEVFSYVVKKAIDSLFEQEFKKKLEEL